MDKKKKSLTSFTQVAAKPNESFTKKYHGSTVQVDIIYIRTVNKESDANQKFDHVGFTVRLNEFGKTHHFVLSNREPKFTKSGHVSLKDMSKGTRTAILDLLYSVGNTPSRTLHRLIGIGINARQIGQFRRYHIADWRTRSAK